MFRHLRAFRRWYYWLPVLVYQTATVMVVGGLSFTMFLVQRSLQSFSGGPLPSWPGVMMSVLVWSYGSLMAGVGIWVFWIMPILASRDMSAPVPDEPRTHARHISFLPWGPAIMPAIYGFTVLVLLPPFEYMRFGRWQWWTEHSLLGLCLLLLSAALAPLGYRLSEHVARRYRQTLAARVRCFGCGYDMRGSASPTCPECGHENEMLRDRQPARTP
ncbi:MAG: hypothetical protein WD009_11550 [Phycisphaeraceae bacterium]